MIQEMFEKKFVKTVVRIAAKYRGEEMEKFLDRERDCFIYHKINVFSKIAYLLFR
jgi:hypothetical protein